MGCVPRHFRDVDPDGAEWLAEKAKYPLVVEKRKGKFASRAGERVDVYYRSGIGGDRWKFAQRGSETAPPEDLLVLADLAVFRGPLPDHESALSELERLAGDLGAHVLTEVHCTAVVGKKHIGGAELVGWIYKASAARRKEKSS